jgi:hypothetical protein
MTRPGACHVRAWMDIACDTSTTMHKERFPPSGLYEHIHFAHVRNVFRVPILFTSQLVLNMCLDYNNLFVRTNENPPYIYIYMGKHIC